MSKGPRFCAGCTNVRPLTFLYVAFDDVGRVHVAPPVASLYGKLFDCNTGDGASRPLWTLHALTDEGSGGGIELQEGGLETSEVALAASAGLRRRRWLGGASGPLQSHLVAGLA